MNERPWYSQLQEKWKRKRNEVLLRRWIEMTWHARCALFVIIVARSQRIVIHLPRIPRFEAPVIVSRYFRNLRMYHRWKPWQTFLPPWFIDPTLLGKRSMRESISSLLIQKVHSRGICRRNFVKKKKKRKKILKQILYYIHKYIYIHKIIIYT